MLKWIMGFFIGCCQILFLPEALSLPWLFGGVIISTTAPIIYTLTVKNYKNLPKRTDLIVASVLFINGFCIGLFWSNLNAHWRLQDKAYTPQISEHIIEAKLVSMPQINRDKQYFNINVTKIDDRKVDLTWSLHHYFPRSPARGFRQTLVPIEFKLGETWQFEVRAKPVAGNLNSAGFDYELWAFSHNISAVATLKSGSQPSLIQENQSPRMALRQWLFNRLEPFQFSGIYQALLLGEKQGISKQQKKIISGLGINHLLAISGLHIAIIAALGLMLGKFIVMIFFYTARFFSGSHHFLRLFQPQQLSVVFSLVCAFIYTSLANYSLPTLRAFIMCATAMVGVLIYRKVGVRKIIGMALGLVLIIFPLSVLEVSFWFTFGAVVVIALFLSGRVKATNKKYNGINLFLRLQIYLTLLMTISSGFVFGQFSLVAFFANCLLIPVFSTALLPLVFIGVLGLLLGFEHLFMVIDNGLNGFFSIAASLNVADWVFSVTIDWIYLIFVLLAFIIIIVPLGRQKFLVFSSVSIILSIIYLNIEYQQKRLDPFIKFFDVGHGLAIFYHDGKHAVLYDTGHATDDYSIAESHIIPALKKLGVNQLDLLIISHSDLDHAGGYEHIVQNFRVKNTVYNRRNDLQCYQGLHWNYGQLHINALWPLGTAKPTLKNNDLSCVLMLDFKSTKILLSGDIEKKSEYQLALLKQKLKADFLVSPHHGSNTSSRYPFIKNVQPEKVIHSSKRYGRFLMPHPEVIERYKNLSVKQLSTACYGEITLNLITKEVSYVRQKRKVWRNKVCRI